MAEETLKTIVAVIAIGFLAYLLFSLYQNNRNSNGIEQAQETLNFILDEIDFGKLTVDIYNPKNWWLRSWPNELGAPKICSDIGSEGCLCICEENSAEGCDKAGVCIYDEGLSIKEPVKIEDPPVTLKIEYGLHRISEVK